MKDPHNKNIPLHIYKGFILVGDPRVSNIGTLEPVTILQPDWTSATHSARECGIMLLPEHLQGKGAV